MKQKMVTDGTRARAEKTHMQGRASRRAGGLANVLDVGRGQKWGIEMTLFSGLRRGKKGVAVF